MNQRNGENDRRKYDQSQRKILADPAKVESTTSWSPVELASNWAIEACSIDVSKIKHRYVHIRNSEVKRLTTILSRDPPYKIKQHMYIENQSTTVDMKGLLEPEWDGDLLYKFREIVGNTYFSEQFKIIASRYKEIITTWMLCGKLHASLLIPLWLIFLVPSLIARWWFWTSN